MYCIKAVYGSYVRIVPSYQEGYRYVPNMYFFRADSNRNIFDIEYFLVGGNSVNVSGIVFKNGEIFNNSFLHYTVSSATDTVEGTAMTDIYGMYYINGIKKGSSIEVIPDYVKLHTVAPLSQIVTNLQADRVLDTFYYTSFSDTIYYSVGGTLFNLPASEQEGLNVVYYINGVEGSDLLFTDTAGKYVIDSLPDGTFVSVIAPDIEGYRVYPSSYTDIQVGPSHYGANFVYIKIDTTVPDTFYCVKGSVSGLPDNRGVTIYCRIINGSTVTTVTAVTGSDSAYSICDLPYGCRVQVSAESRNGFLVHEYYDDILIDDTVFGINFTYESIPDGYYTVTGIVYVSDVATPGIEIYSNIGGSLRSYTTDIWGRYTIVVPERTSFSIHPSYMENYKVTPSGGYSIVQIMENSAYNNFYYDSLSQYDTVSSLCGVLDSLPEALRNGQIVTAIVQGVVYYTLTDADGGYCFMGVPARTVVIVLPPDVSGYEHTPAVRTVDMPSYDTTIPPFVYSSIVKDTLILCGAVSGLPDNSNVLVTYFVDNDINTLRTDSLGIYCIKVVEGDYVRIVPSYQQDYRFEPNMYFFRAYSSEDTFDIEYFPVDSGSITVSGAVVKDGNIFSNAFLHYTLTFGSSAVDAVTMTDIYGMYYINGLAKGSSIEVVPDYVKLHTVTPLLQLAVNLQADRVFDTFYYTSFASADTAFYSVSGTLYGLSASEREGLNIEYFVNSVSGSDLLLTDAAGKYLLDSLRRDMYVSVIAPAVAGYNVYPSSYSNIQPSYYGANFVYIKTEIDTILPHLVEDTARLESVLINGVSLEITDVIHYILPCKDSAGYIDVDYVNVVLMVSEYDTIYSDGLEYTREREYTYTVYMDSKAFYKVDTVIVRSTGIGSTAEQLKHTYIIIVERRFEFYDIVVEYVKDRIFMVNNNRAGNGDYKFAGYKWYVNDMFNGGDTNQMHLSGPGYEYKFSDNPDWLYRVELLTVEGTPLQTCPDKSGVTVYNNVVYPNPAPKAGEIYFANPLDVEDYRTATLYTVQGHKLWQRRSSDVVGGFTAPVVSGAYILLLQGEGGSVRYKVVVK
jgi:hypothetical protein